MSEVCIPFGELGLTTESAGAFGAWAERKITDRYLKDVGRFKDGEMTNFFPFNVADFHDPAHTWSRTGLLGEFIMTHNPDKMNETKWRSLQSVGGVLRVPDLMTHDPPRRDFEFYEIKPASWSGLPAGLLKAQVLTKLFKDYKLPYNAGLTWNVNERELFARAIVWGTPVEYYLHYFRSGPGLVLYEICFRGALEELATKAAFIAAATYVLLLSIQAMLGALALA